MYAKFGKRLLDLTLSVLALLILSPVLLILTVAGAIAMKGNPFFVQPPDDKRLTKYGRLLRSTSLDELPELINILIGNMSIGGERGIIRTTKKMLIFADCHG